MFYHALGGNPFVDLSFYPLAIPMTALQERITLVIPLQTRGCGGNVLESVAVLIVTVQQPQTSRTFFSSVAMRLELHNHPLDCIARVVGVSTQGERICVPKGRHGIGRS